MGLDMFLRGEKYFYTNWEKPEENLREDGFELKTKTLEIGYWRKHPNLHGFIVQTFARGVDKCQEIDLSMEDLSAIIKAVEERTLPETKGFFFGSSQESDERVYEDIKILKAAQYWMATKENGVSKRVFYQASW